MLTLLSGIYSSIASKVSPIASGMASKVISIAPFPIGIFVGYFFHGPLKLVVDAVKLIAKL